MIIIIRTIQVAYVVGDNKNGQLGLQNKKTYTQFETIPKSASIYEFVALSDAAGYLSDGSQVNGTGDSFIFEGDWTPTPPFGKLLYMTSFHPIKIGVSTSHAITLDTQSKIHTLGRNDYGQLARNTTSGFSTAQTNPPQWYEQIITVGAVQYLSFIVYPSAIFVAGECDDCLCGLDDNGQEDSNNYNTWHKLNIDELANQMIKNVIFGPNQYVIETQFKKYYFMGESDYNNACQQSQCKPQELPFTDVAKIIVTEYSTSYLSKTDEIFYCGCALQKSCTPVSQLTKYSITASSIIDYFPMQSKIYVITDLACFQFQNVSNSWALQRCIFNGSVIPTRLAGYRQSLIAYYQLRYLKINIYGPGSVTLSIDNIPQTLYLPLQLEVPYSFSTVRYGQQIKIDVQSPNMFPIQDMLTMESSNVTTSYTLTANQNNFEITFILYNMSTGHPFRDQIQIIITSQYANKEIYNNIDQSGQPIQISTQNMFLYDTFTIQIKTQTLSFAKKTFQYKIISPTSRINVYLQPIDEQYIQFFDYYLNEIPNIQITVYNLNGSVHNTEITNKDGYISIPRLSTDPKQGGITVRIYFAGNSRYQQFDSQINISFQNSTKLVFLQLNNEYFYVEITHQTNGTVKFFYPNGTSFYNITFPVSANNTLQYREQVVINKQWNISNVNVTATFEDPQNQTYAFNITKEISNGVFFSFNVMQRIQTIVLAFIDQKNQIVPNYQVQVTTDNNVTRTSYQTDSQGEVSFQANTYDMLQKNESILLWSDETDDYAALNEIIDPNAQVQPYNIQVYKYSIFQLNFHIADSKVPTGIPGITLLLYDQSGQLLFNETSDASGNVQISVSERLQIIQFNQQYTVELLDPQSQYSSQTGQIYTNTPVIMQNYLLNANKLKFLIYDIRSKQIAQGAQLSINIGQRTSYGVSDNLGILFADIHGQFQINSLYYSVVSTDIYKPQSAQAFQYQVGVIRLTVESWYNFSISIQIVDGKTNIPLSGINASIYTASGQLRYWQVTNYTGVMQANYSERHAIVEIGPVYNLSIVDTYGRYKNFNVNYSISSPYEHDRLPLNIQQLTLVVANYDAKRVGGITVNIYSDGMFLGQRTSNQLGIINFYLKASQFVNKKVTYSILQSQYYRPKNPRQLRISKNPQLQLIRVFPLIIFKFEINIMLPQNESNIYINVTNTSTHQDQYQANRPLQSPSSMNNKQLQVQSFEFIEGNPYNQNLQLEFLDRSNHIVYQKNVDNIFAPLDLWFVENINETFQIENHYKMKIIDKTKRYLPVELNFTLMTLDYDFNVQLEMAKHHDYTLPITITLIILGTIMGSFSIYAIVRLIKMKKKFRKMYIEQGLKFSKQEYEENEQIFIEQCIKDLDKGYRDYIQTHKIVRQKVIKQQVCLLSPDQSNLINSSKIFVHQKIEASEAK